MQRIEYETALPGVGTLLIELRGGRVVGLGIGGGKVVIRPAGRQAGCLPAGLLMWLDLYFKGPAAAQGVAPPPLSLIDMDGTVFELKVWRALLKIEFGAVRTYGEIAAQIGAPGAARAVGTACGKNRLPVIVPCHRVVPRYRGAPGSGGFGGYSAGAGVGTKVALLRFEGALPLG